VEIGFWILENVPSHFLGIFWLVGNFFCGFFWKFCGNFAKIGEKKFPTTPFPL
jgi:hypothetical protein